ncbi:LLM class flavin-dependent oxidoreductase [Paenibacillus chibensis]|uniref:LLM class flavin-dependent oxidoreductase n=1 Tax=Paenibacillus chibensis TaxID=59846 RepID=UPI002E23FA44
MPGLACTSTDVLLSHIGAKTQSIRIGSGALLLPHYKPLKVTESFHLLASLYPGRVDLGLGRAPGGSADVSLALSDKLSKNVVWKMPDLLRSVYSVSSFPCNASDRCRWCRLRGNRGGGREAGILG